jgi:cysteine desulfurase
MDGIADENTRIRALRDRFEQAVVGTILEVVRNGSRDQRLPNTSNLAFRGVEAEAILLLLDRIGVCASSGSACTTGSLEPSHVLTAMGLPLELARGSIRFSFGRYNTEAEVDYLLQRLPGIVAQLRGVPPPAAA